MDFKPSFEITPLWANAFLGYLDSPCDMYKNQEYEEYLCCYSYFCKDLYINDSSICYNLLSSSGGEAYI